MGPFFGKLKKAVNRLSKMSLRFSTFSGSRFPFAERTLWKASYPDRVSFHLGSTNLCPTAVCMEPFSTSAFRPYNLWNFSYIRCPGNPGLKYFYSQILVAGRYCNHLKNFELALRFLFC